jgi:hypothetical protein
MGGGGNGGNNNVQIEQNPHYVYDSFGVLVGYIPKLGTSFSLQVNGQSAIDALLALDGIIDPDYLALYQLHWSGISQQTLNSDDFKLGANTYTAIQESEYEILNDGTLSVSSDGGIDPNNPDSKPNMSWGKIKIPKEIRLFNREYFDNLIDIKVHELVPTKPAGWPKEPPVFRQVWPHKAGPGGWPSGPELVSKGPKAKENSWTRDDYYTFMFPGSNDGNIPSQTLIDSWGPITSNREYPYPPGVLSYNVIEYIRDGSSWYTQVKPEGVGPAGVGKYVVLSNDRPLFVADAYNYKTVPGSQEEIIYGNDTEVEDGLEYEWIVDGNVVSTNKYYQLWGVSPPHDTYGATGEAGGNTPVKNNSFDTTAVNITLIVKNEIGSVSTNISYLVWGGFGKAPSGYPNNLPLDLGYGNWNGFRGGQGGAGNPEEPLPENWFWGTPIFRSGLSNGNSTYTWVDLSEGNQEPWGSYYTWDGNAEEVIVLKDDVDAENEDPDFRPIDNPWVIWVNQQRGFHDASESTVPVGLINPPNVPFVDTDFDISIPSNNSSSPRIDRSIKLPKDKFQKYQTYSLDFNIDIISLKEFLNYWRDDVWSYNGKPNGLQVGSIYSGQPVSSTTNKRTKSNRNWRKRSSVLYSIKDPNGNYCRRSG